jgi:hypothetical protein
MTSRKDCWFCHVPKASDDVRFCTNCGRELEAKGNFIDLSTTTANYDPMHPARKPWKEPVPLRKKPTTSKPAFYNSIPWGKNVPPARAAHPKESEDSKLLHSEHSGYQDSVVYMDGVQYKGLRFINKLIHISFICCYDYNVVGYYWKKTTQASIRLRKKRVALEQAPVGKIVPHLSLYEAVKVFIRRSLH